MYLSSDDARSDFLLAAIVYVLGPTILGLLVRSTGSLFAGDVGRWVLAVGAPLLLIWAMPLWLMRYRGEAWSTLWAGPSSAVLAGLALGAVVVVATVAGDLVSGLPATDLVVGQLRAPSLVVSRLLNWLGLALLTTFLWRRAEYAFRTISEPLGMLLQRAALGTVGAAVVASLLLAVRFGSAGLVLAPLGFAGAYLLGLRLLEPSGMGEQWRVYAPLIVLALGPLEIFSLLFDPLDFLSGLRAGGMVAAFGLLAVMALETRRGGRAGLVLGGTVALLSSVTAFQGF